MRCSTDAAFDEAWLRADIYKEVLHGLVTLNSDALEKGHFCPPPRVCCAQHIREHFSPTARGILSAIRLSISTPL
jgi:NADPH-dependent glutamate synthase beta subunit-like oxidoreductase